MARPEQLEVEIHARHVLEVDPMVGVHLDAAFDP
jgi:hypothetical protein